MPGARTTIMWVPLPCAAIRTRALSRSILQVASAVTFSRVSMPNAASSCPIAKLASAGMKASSPPRATGWESTTREGDKVGAGVGFGAGVGSDLPRMRPISSPKLWPTRRGPRSPSDTPSTSRASARLRRAKRVRDAEGAAPRSLRLASAKTCHKSGRNGKIAAPAPTTSQFGDRCASRPAQGTSATAIAAPEQNSRSHALLARLVPGREGWAMSISSMTWRIACPHAQSHDIRPKSPKVRV